MNCSVRHLLSSFPELRNTRLGQDSIDDREIIINSTSALTNRYTRDAAMIVEASSEAKNSFIRSTYFINPISWFQNSINSLSETDYYAYKQHREKIQELLDAKVYLLLMDGWNKIVVDKQKFLEYVSYFKSKDLSK